MSTRRTALVLAALALTAPLPAGASDGVLEIHHACASGPGCFPGDTSGYPVEVTASGSYRLTSDLQVPAATNGIELAASASLDLGGFSVSSNVSCATGCPAPGAGSGIVAAAFATQNRVANGKVRGFALDGIALGQLARVEGVTISDVARHGINLGGGSLASDNLITRVGQNGMLFAVPPIGAHIPSLYLHNTISTTGGASVSGGRAGGPNVCPDQLCGTTGKKLFFMTLATTSGASADNACGAGFHMASFWEIRDTTAVEYDTTRGYVLADSAQGPPTATHAWVRTGYFASDLPNAGVANCLAWTSSSDADSGSAVYLANDWLGVVNSPTTPAVPATWPCESQLRVWCVQD